MAVRDGRMIAMFAVAALIGTVESRAVNISNTWMLPEEGFPVFYRYFRDRISWYEADAVCQFHHANLVTADSSSEYDAIRAYLKELDISEKVWIGLSKTKEKRNFSWTNFRPLTGEGHWQQAFPVTGPGESLCAIMDPAADFLWRPLPCGGPEIAAFICELTIPSWAEGPKGCLLTELPSLTVLYIPEQSAVELTSDCGLDGTKRIACKGNADREELLRQLTCAISNEDFDDKSTRSSVMTFSSTTSGADYETSTVDENFLGDKTTKSWTSNTIDVDYGMPTRHRRETEDTLSPVSTKSSFHQVYANTDVSWKLSNRLEAVLTTRETFVTDDEAVTPTAAGGNYAATGDGAAADATPTSDPGISGGISSDKSTTRGPKLTDTSAGPAGAGDSRTYATAAAAETRAAQEGSGDEFPSAINQGQLFSIIENGTMFDIIELNETSDSSPTEAKAKEYITTDVPQKNSDAFPKVYAGKKYYPKNLPPTKKSLKNSDPKKANIPDPNRTVQKKIPKETSNEDKTETDLNKEFEMLPDIKDTSVKLNRTFRKEVPSSPENEDNFKNLKAINFSVNNNLSGEEQDNIEITFHDEGKNGNITETIIFSSLRRNVTDEGPNLMSILRDIENLTEKSGHMSTTNTDIDSKLNILNENGQHNDSEFVPTPKIPFVPKKEFLPESLHLVAEMTTEPSGEQANYTNFRPFPSDGPKKANRKRQFSHNQKKTFYPYFFSRMLG